MTLNPNPMRNPTYIVWHTAAHYNKRLNVVFDTDKDDLYQWHVVERGWTDIGYHYLVRWDGTVEECRPVNKRGAHVRGLNHKSIGICFSGSGEQEPLKLPQLIAGIALTRLLQERFNIQTSDVIGHNEIMDLIEAGKVSSKFRTSKSCPGKYINMDEIREQISPKPDPCAGCKCRACPER